MLRILGAYIALLAQILLLPATIITKEMNFQYIYDIRMALYHYIGCSKDKQINLNGTIFQKPSDKRNRAVEKYNSTKL